MRLDVGIGFYNLCKITASRGEWVLYRGYIYRNLTLLPPSKSGDPTDRSFGKCADSGRLNPGLAGIRDPGSLPYPISERA